MAQWTDFLNYESLQTVVNQPPKPAIEGLRQAINERSEYIDGNDSKSLEEMEVGRVWFNENVYRDDGDNNPGKPSGDAIEVIRQRVEEYCEWFFADMFGRKHARPDRLGGRAR